LSCRRIVASESSLDWTAEPDSRVLDWCEFGCVNVSGVLRRCASEFKRVLSSGKLDEG